MKVKHKAILIWSLVFWSLILLGLILFGLSLGQVKIGNYGILRNYFKPYTNQQYYTPGLYYIDVGYFFVQFPSSKQVLSDLKVNTTNKDLQSIQVQYSLAYRINPDKLYQMYNSMGLQYQTRLISVINSIIANVFMLKTQAQTRVYAQTEIINSIINGAGLQKMAIFNNSIAIQGLWINQILFNQLEKSYDSAYIGTSSYSEDYIKTQLQLQKTIILIQSMKDLIKNMESTFLTQINQDYSKAKQEAKANEVALKLQQIANISLNNNLSRIFSYYNPSKLAFN